MKDFFYKIAHKTSEIVGSVWAFLIALLVVGAWAVTGPLFDFSDTWQLVINTGTTIITFLMVFLIQNMQNRDSKVLHLKLDELIRATHKARNRLVDLEDLSEAEIEKLEKEFHQVHRRIRRRRQKRPAKTAE
jgi:low affinity Fe/Cu permease